jgi:hypothetical protein
VKTRTTRVACPQACRTNPRRFTPLFGEQLEARRMLTADWQNLLFAWDVNDDGFLAPNDALAVINDLNALGSRQLVAPPSSADPYVDVDGDGYIAPNDALSVINQINARFLSLAVSMSLSNDTGSSASDRVTSDPSLRGQAVLSGVPLSIARIRVNHDAVTDLPIDSSGHFLLDPRTVETVADGDVHITIYLKNAAGAEGLQQLRFTLDTIAPVVTSPHILPADDSGYKSDDNYTSITQPRVTFSTEAGAQLHVQLGTDTLFDGPSPGSFLHQLKTLADGAYQLSATAEDIAGNVSSATSSLIIDTHAPPVPTLDLARASDSGTPGDRTTHDSSVTLVGLTEGNSFVTIGAAGPTVRTSSDGSFSVPSIPLNLGTNTFALHASDLAGNTSNGQQIILRADEAGSTDPVLRWDRVRWQW